MHFRFPTGDIMIIALKFGCVILNYLALYITTLLWPSGWHYLCFTTRWVCPYLGSLQKIVRKAYFVKKRWLLLCNFVSYGYYCWSSSWMKFFLVAAVTLNYKWNKDSVYGGLHLFYAFCYWLHLLDSIALFLYC